MTEVTDLHILAKMAMGTPSEEDAFVVRDEKDKVIAVIHNLRELIEVLSNLTHEQMFPSLCRLEKGDTECDLALWVHYVLGDAVLAAKIYNLVDEYKNDSPKLKIEVFNLCFNRFLNFQEMIDHSDDFSMFEDEEVPPSNI